VRLMMRSRRYATMDAKGILRRLLPGIR
jgi:hypothetical protein